MAAPTRDAYRQGLMAFADLAHALGAAPPMVLSPWEAAEWVLPDAPEGLSSQARAIGAAVGVDWALTPAAGRRKRLLVADMDSTIISCECLDELAAFAGKKAEVSLITERAMRGELAFEDALAQRVAMLKGLPLGALDACFEDRVRLNPGAAALVATMTAHGARCVLVSGGFTAFTRRVAALAGFAADRANRLEDDGAALTGRVLEPILGREAKRAALEEEAAALGVAPADALAIGDGANDLAMLTASGLGVAYRAKPIVAAQAHASIEHTDLRTALFFQGYRRAEILDPPPSAPTRAEADPPAKD